ncbi:19839_t:CDS:2, partial [Racocetra fulgida]
IQTAKGEYRFRLAGLNIMANKKQIPLGFSKGDQESKGRKKTKDTDTKNLSSEDDILTQLEKDGS